MGDTPRSFIGAGVGVMIVGGILIAVAELVGSTNGAVGFAFLAFGVVAAVTGQLMALVGVVAAGVRMGMKWSRYDERVGP